MSHAEFQVLYLGFLGLGCILLLRGMRGDQIDDHPICRHCRFDLTGLPNTSKCCPECGADLARPRALMHGHRASRVKMMWLGGILTGSALLAIGLSLSQTVRDFRIIHHVPESWLLKELESESQEKVDPALDEVLRRLDRRELPKAPTLAAAEIALQKQKDPSQPWDIRWGILVELAWDRKVLKWEQWARYARHSHVLSLRSPALVTRGDPLTMQLNATPRLKDYRFLVLYNWDHLRAHPISAQATRPGFWWDLNLGRRGHATFEESQTRHLAIGDHTATGVVKIRIWDASTVDRRDAVSPPSSLPLVEFDQELSADFSVIEAVP